MSQQIWFRQPSILFAPNEWNRFVPTKQMTTAEALNSVVRFSIYFSVLLFLATSVSSYLLAIPAVMVASIGLYTLFPNGKTIENFLNTKSVPETKSYTMPEKDNAFMNPLLTDIGDNPDRPESAPVNRRDVKAAMHREFQKTGDIYMDTTDLFDQTQAMRTFHTTSSGTIPSDQDGFLKWLGKGQDAPDYSSAFPARNGKILSEGHVKAKGSMSDLPNTTSRLSGTAPSRGSALPATSSE
jgi:hypothetical protein